MTKGVDETKMVGSDFEWAVVGLCPASGGVNELKIDPIGMWGSIRVCEMVLYVVSIVDVQKYGLAKVPNGYAKVSPRDAIWMIISWLSSHLWTIFPRMSFLPIQIVFVLLGSLKTISLGKRRRGEKPYQLDIPIRRFHVNGRHLIIHTLTH